MSAQIIPFPNRTGFDPEMSKSRLASLWGCSRKTIERYMDPAYTGPKGIEPLPSVVTPYGRRFRLSEVNAWRARWDEREVA